MDSVQCTKIIKENYPQIKIIILTTFDDDEYVYNALKFGASGYLLKGVSMDELENAVRTVYNGRAMINPDIATKVLKLLWEFLKLLTYDEQIQMDIFRYSQGASVLRTVTQSEEMENIVQQDMEEGDTVISGLLLGRVIEEGHIKPQFKRYEQAMVMADGEINRILEDDETIDSSLKILQRTINSYLQQ